MIFIVALLAAAVVLGKVQNDARAGGRLDPVSRTVQAVVSPLSSASRSVTGWFSDFGHAFTHGRRIESENQMLRNQMAATSLYVEQVARLNREINSLRQLQNLPKLPGTSSVLTDITGYFPDVNRISIPKGQRDGLKPGMPIATAAGLLAIIQTVEANSSQAMLLTSPAVKVGAMDLSRNPPCTGFLRGMDSRTLSFTLFEPKSPIEIGDIIVTSGFGERIPRGLVIGKIIQIEDNPELGIKRALVDPAVEIGEVREVTVVK